MSFRICVVGCGRFSTRCHGPSYSRYAAVHPEVQLAACCDLDEMKALQFRERFGFARHYRDLDEMLKMERPDAVCLLVPPHLSVELGCHIMSLRYPLMLEKPPGRTVQEVDLLIATANSYNIPNQVAFNRRFTPLFVKLKNLIQSQLDDRTVRHIHYAMTRFGRTDADFSLTAIHGIDTARWLAQDDFTEVRFHYQTMPHFGETVANIFMDGTFGSGITVHLSFLPVSGAVFERATIHADDHTWFLSAPMWEGFDGAGSLQHVERGMLKLDVHGEESTEFIRMGFDAENTSFFDDIREGRHPVDDLKSARQSVQIAEYMRERKSKYVR